MWQLFVKWLDRANKFKPLSHTVIETLPYGYTRWVRTLNSVYHHKRQPVSHNKKHGTHLDTLIAAKYIRPLITNKVYRLNWGNLVRLKTRGDLQSCHIYIIFEGCLITNTISWNNLYPKMLPISLPLAFKILSNCTKIPIN